MLFKVDMATIDISKNHSLPVDDVKRQAEELAKNMEAKLGISWKWEGTDTIVFDAPSGVAKGTKGHLKVTDREVRIAIDLPLLLRAMKGAVEGKIREKLDKIG
jgi:putative polyhydroxyalkanoate system protein